MREIITYNYWLLFLVGLFLFAGNTTQAQQDPQFSQYMFNHLAINPAYAGSREAMSFVGSHRSQWVGFNGSPSTQALSFHTPLKNNKIGVGGNLINDKIGPTSMFGAFGSFAYKLKLAQGQLAFGLKGGIYNYGINWDEINLKDQTDPYASFQGSESQLLPSFDFGLMFSTHTFFAGLAINHLNRPGISFSADTFQTAGSTSNLVGHATFTLGKAFVLNEKWVFRPSLLVRSAGEVSAMLDVNASVVYANKVWFGLSFRRNYGFVVLTRFNISDAFAIGYSFDVGLTELNTAGSASGSHEIYLSYDLPLKKRKVLSPRYF